jgi:Flp pilus assembly protein TadD
VLYYQGKQEEAIQTIQGVLDENPKMDGIRPLFAIYLGNSGRREDARAQLTEEARNLAKADHDMAYWMASAYTQLGEKDEAFYWLERAIKLGNENKPWFENDRLLAPLRDDPRFAEAIGKIGKDD